MLRRTLSSLLPTALLALPGQAQDRTAVPMTEAFSPAQARAVRAEREAAAETLSTAIETGAARAALTAAAGVAADQLPGSPDASARLRAAVDQEDAALERTLERIADDLRFRPYVEAEVPIGWPDPTPVGEIVLKAYPRYRMAKTSMNARGGTSTPFFALFNHIKRNDIAMTAPVQIDYAKGNRNATRTESMSFLYAHPNQGETGADGADERVEVVNVEPLLAVSIGARGYESPQRIQELEARLEAWLAAHASEFEAAGAMRTMGYNSPMIPSARRFFEVELPVRRVVDRDE